MEFVKKAKISTDDFYYDLFDGGYIKPEKLLKSKDDMEKVKSAIAVIKDFKSSAEKADILEYQ